MSELVVPKHSARTMGASIIALVIIALTPIYLFSAETAPPSDQCEKAKSELTVAGGYRAIGEIDKALEAYRAIVKERSSCRAQAAEAQLHIGEHFQAKKMVKEAAEAFEVVVRNFKDQPDLCIAALGKMARTYKASDKLEQALQSNKRIIDAYPSRPADCADAMLARASIFEEAGAYQKAESECRKLMKLYGANPALKPRCREAHYRIACVMKVAGRLDEALKAFAGIKDDPSDTYAARALLKRGEILTEQGKLDEAIAEFQKLVDTYPQHKNTCLQARFLMADRLLERGDLADARAITKEALKEEETLKKYPHMYFDIMVLQRHAGDADWRETAKKYHAAMKAFGYGGKADFCPVEIAYYFEKDLPKAGKLAAEFLGKHPDHTLAPEAAFIQARCILSSSDNACALEALDRLLDRYENFPGAQLYTNSALLDAADLLEKSGRRPEAEKRLRRMSVRSPSEKIFKYLAIGRLHFRANKFETAARAFARGAATNGAPLDMVCEALYRAGEAYYQSGAVASAARCWQALIDRAPDSSWAREARGALYIGQTSGR